MMQEAATLRVERRLAAIMAADVAGYSRLMGADEEGTLAQLKAHRRELGDPKIKEHRGRVVKTTGDGLLVEFVSPVEAVRCAVEIQRGMVSRNSEVPQDKRITFRMGINLGDVIAEEGDLFGDGVNVAARLEALCEPGGVAISRTVRDQIRDKLPFVFDDAGEHEVKNIARPIRVYALPAAAIEALPEAQLMHSPQSIGRRRVGGIPTIAIAALASLIVVAGGFWWLRSSDITPFPAVISATADKQTPPAALITAVAPSAALAKLGAQTAPRMSIVVLPFTNLSGDPSQEYFADGFSEDLTTDLSRISGSFVIARTTAYTYKGKALSENQIASELSVRYVLEGGVQKAGNQLRVNARLIDGETGAQLWAERYDRDSAEMLRTQDEITNQIANALNLTLVQSEANRSWRDHPSNPDSLDLTLRANALLNGPTLPEINANAQRLYQQAIELDPQNADAFVGLAWTYLNVLEENWPKELGYYETLKRADDAVRRALSIKPQFASAYSAKSQILAYSNKNDYRGEIAQAIEAAEAALALNPNRPGTIMWLGRLYSKAGHPERTKALVEQAIRLDPKSPDPPFYALGMSQLQMGHNDEAIENFQRSLLLNPRKLISWGGLTGALFAAGREVEAKNALVKWREIAVTDEGYKPSGDSDVTDILNIRLQLALIQLGRWPFAVDLVLGKELTRPLTKFQADENLPQTGQPDEATLARLGITSQASASTSK
jgi:adenylate cyclase